jgi:predicted nucleotidyltransferase
MKTQQIKRTNAVLKDFKAEVEKLYGERLKDVILYGSWARRNTLL